MSQGTTAEPTARRAASRPLPPTFLRGILRGGTLAVLVAVVVQSIGNLVFHAVAGRSLPPAEYGALGTVLAVMVLLAVPLSGLQTAASAAVAARGGTLTTGSARRVVGVPTAWSLLPALLLAGAAPGVRDWFHLADASAAVLLAPSLVVAVALACVRGMLLGASAPGAVAVGYVVSVAVRLLSVLVVPPTVTGALLGSLAGEVLATALALGAVARRTRPGAPVLLGRLRVARSVTALLVLFLLTSGDMFLARHHLAPDASGAYVASATVAKTALALPAAAMAVLFPRLVTAWASARPARAVVRVGGAVLALAATGAAVVAAVPGLLLHLLFHDAYQGATGLLRLLALTAVLSSVVTVCVNSALARGSWAAVLVPAAGAVLELLLITARHVDTGQVAWGSVLSALATALLALAVEARVMLRANGTREVANPARTLRDA